jgi:hypothetical protein
MAWPLRICLANTASAAVTRTGADKYQCMPAEQEFQKLIRAHSQSTGFDMPLLLEQYVIELLASRLDRVDIIPEPSFAERYLTLYQEFVYAQWKDYADSALFFCSLMPEYGQRRGLNMDYYATLGISTYYALGDMVQDPRFTQLGNWFYHLQRFLNTAIHPEQRLELFRF